MAELTAAPAAADRYRATSLSNAARWWLTVRYAPFSIRLCFSWLVVVALGAILAPQLATVDPVRQDLRARLLKPIWLADGSWTHPFGTDQVGYDIFSRLLYGARPALEIGVLATIGSFLVGTTLGLVAGYFRGTVDTIIMMLADAQMSIPFLLIAIAVVAAVGQSMTVLVMLAAFGGWMGFARAIRSLVFTLSEREFIYASRASGATNGRILVRHLLPNLSSMLLVLATLQVRGMILFEASMSFLGLGVLPPSPSWGSMINGGRDYVLTAWWITMVPGVALMLTVLATSLIGDWLRDVLDPNMRSVK